jgi:hypothetical protein
LDRKSKIRPFSYSDSVPWSCMKIGKQAEVEVVLVKGSLGQEAGAAGEGFQIEELAFDEGVDGFNIALEGVGGRKVGAAALIPC